VKLEIGQVVQNFVVERVLGSGGTAVVYLVRERTTGDFSALKVLSVSSPAIRERMRREGEVQSALRHPNIVPVRDVIDLDGSPALVMEFIEGPTLDAALRRYRLTLDDAELLFGGILAGVHAAHASGLVHRDLKPANVLLSSTVEGFVPKVTDFGLAKILVDIPGLAHTRQGISMGTPSYMAPEQIRDAGSVDIRADLWSLGCLLYELMTRRRAFPGEEALAIYNAVVDASYTPPRQWMPELPDRVNDAILGCLQLDPDDRIPDCQTLLDVLRGEADWMVATTELRNQRPWSDEESTADPLDAGLPSRFSADGPDRPAAGVAVHETSVGSELVLEAGGEDTLPMVSEAGLAEEDLIRDGAARPPIAMVHAQMTGPDGAESDEEATVAVRLTELVPSGELPPRPPRRPRVPTPDGPLPRRTPSMAPPARPSRTPVYLGLGAAGILLVAFAIGASASALRFLVASAEAPVEARLEPLDEGPAADAVAERTVTADTLEPPAPPPRPSPVRREPPPVAAPAGVAEEPARVIRAQDPPAPQPPGTAEADEAPAPEVPASLPPVEVKFLSTMHGAVIHVDGAAYGKTPKKGELVPGPHVVQMVSGDREGHFEVTVGPDSRIFCYVFEEKRHVEGICPK